ncbi:MAG: hypothetical protein R3C53_28010 [Pirellulaceae bacterium]
MRFSLRQLLLYVTLVAFATWFVRAAYQGLTQVETGESLARVDWLPEDATNVSFYRSYMNTAYEFDISESGFRDWSRWDVTEIQEPVGLSRYLAFSTPRPVEPPNPTPEQMKAFALEYSRRGVTIRDGLYYGHTHDNGGGVWVGYDRTCGRAYYQSAPR